MEATHPRLPARISGVLPLTIRLFGFAPASTNVLMTSQCPLVTAMCSGVEPQEVVLASSSAPAFTNIFVTARCPPSPPCLQSCEPEIIGDENAGPVVEQSFYDGR